MTLRSITAAVACLAVTGTVTSGQQPATPISFRDVQRVALPAYTAYPTIGAYAPTPAEYEEAVNDRAFVMERLTYRSDGLDVYAYLYRPANPPTRKLPVIVFNRGGYTRDDFSPEVLMPGHRLARQGYLIIAPMLRGSGGAGGHDEMGGADLHDVFNIIPVIKDIPYADADRIFLYGQSRGGIMSLLAARDNFPARAIAVFGAITDIAAYIAADTGGRQLVPVIWPNMPANQDEVFGPRSANRWPERINTPLLLMHGGADGQVTPMHSIQLATALHNLKKPYELKILYGANHMLTQRAQERDEAAVQWFRRFDQSPPAK